MWAEDELSPGLEYVSSTASDPAVTAYPGQDHLGNPMNGVYWHVPEIPAGGTVTIDITARLIACQGLTDEARAGISCGGDECHPIVSDTSSVLIPDTVLVATSHLPSPMAACQETEADITIRNAGDPTAYTSWPRMALPPGVEYVPGSTQWQVDGPPVELRGRSHDHR